jgi:hypothetical protein
MNDGRPRAWKPGEHPCNPRNPRLTLSASSNLDFAGKLSFGAAVRAGHRRDAVRRGRISFGIARIAFWLIEARPPTA